MIAAGIQWESRALPSDEAVSTWHATAPDGHELQADLYGSGLQVDPYIVALQALPLEQDCGVANPLRPLDDEIVLRWPNIDELFSALDAVAPGCVFQLLVTAQPLGVPRKNPPAGTPFGLKALQIAGPPDGIEIVRA